MPNVQFKLVKRPPKAAQQHKIVQTEIRAGLKRSGNKATKKYGDVVAGWRHEPTFKSTVRVGSKQITYTIKVGGSTKAQLIWLMIDETGAKAHVITAKGNKPLGFFWGGPGSYVPVTSIGGGFGGPGRVMNGKPYNTFEIHHPGFEPRNISVKLNPKIDEDARREIRNGIARGRRRI